MKKTNSSFNLLLTVLFIIIIFNVVVNRIPSHLIMGTLSVWFVILWISWDNMGAWDYNNIIDTALKTCGVNLPKSRRRKKIEKKIKKLEEDSSDSEPEETIEDIITEKMPSLPNQPNPPSGSEPNDEFPGPRNSTGVELPNKNAVINNFVPNGLIPFSQRPMPLEYSENNYKHNLFNELGSLGDNGLAQLQKFRGNLNRVAIDNFARQDKYTNINYIEQDLIEYANSRWWDDDVHLEAKF
jgi:hypothetical protein